MPFYFRTGIGPFRYSARLSPRAATYGLCGIAHRTAYNASRCRSCQHVAAQQLAAQQADAAERAAAVAEARRVREAMSPDERQRADRNSAIVAFVLFMVATVPSLWLWGWLAAAGHPGAGAGVGLPCWGYLLWVVFAVRRWARKPARR